MEWWDVLLLDAEAGCSMLDAGSVAGSWMWILDAGSDSLTFQRPEKTALGGLSLRGFSEWLWLPWLPGHAVSRWG
jgi:hypothetical protein